MKFSVALDQENMDASTCVANDFERRGFFIMGKKLGGSEKTADR